MTEFDRLKKTISESPSNFVVILGAGASVPAGLPTWGELKDILCEAVHDFAEDEEDYAQKIENINSAKDLWGSFSRLRTILGKSAYERVITEALDVSHAEIPQLYQQIWKLNVSGVIDFNLDKLAINAYSQINKTAVDFATGTEPHKYMSFPASYEKFVFFPHGIVTDTSSWVFTPGERDARYHSKDFTNLFGSILNSKDLLIIGFNVEEWSFLDLLSQVGICGRLGGNHNYYLCPEASPDKKRELGEYGINVISYKPTDKQHTELNNLLNLMLAHKSVDMPLPAVYNGALYSEADIPSEEEFYKISTADLRNILNGVVASISPAGTVPTREQTEKLEAFYSTYIPQIHRAWLVDPRNPASNMVYGYKVTGFIGTGAFGSVYEAENDKGDRFALKVLLSEVKDKASYLNCFRRGIRSMSILTDKNVPGMVKIHDSYEIPACIVMDIVDGITLRTAIDNRYLVSLDTKLCVLKEIASIIRTAHRLEESILHRDLKPENIMFEHCYTANDFNDPRTIPEVKVLDFDLSWHRGATEKTVMAGAISQGFMAPEQIDTTVDKSLSRSTAVDVYSIGMLAYYMLTGKNPTPNQPLHDGFSEQTFADIRNSYKFNWKSLPYLLRDTIVNTTKFSQANRISLDTFLENISVAKMMHLHNELPNTHPLLLRELRQRTADVGEETITDFGRTLHIKGCGVPIDMTLSTTSVQSQVVLNVSVKRIADAADRRDGRSKYFQSKKERALAAVKKGGCFTQYDGESSAEDIIIQMSTALPETLTLSYIEQLAEIIRNVRGQLGGK